jgi:hypothetical protein
MLPVIVVRASSFVIASFVIVILVIVVISVIIVMVWLRRLWLRIRRGRLWLRLRSGRRAGVWLRRHIATGQQRQAPTAALRAFWGQRERQAPLDMRGAGGQRQEQEKVFHFASHRLLSEKYSCRLPSCTSSVGLPFLWPTLATDMRLIAFWCSFSQVSHVSVW